MPNLKIIVVCLASLGISSPLYAQTYQMQVPVSVDMQKETVNLGSIAAGSTFEKYVLISHKESGTVFPSVEDSGGLQVSLLNCDSGLNTNQACQVVIKGIIPEGPLTTTVYVKVGNVMKVLAVVGTGVSAADSPTLSPAVAGFGNVSVGSKASTSITITNPTSEDIDPSSLKMPTGIKLTDCDNIPAGGSCTATLSWSPLIATTLSQPIYFNSAAGKVSIGYVTGNAQKGELSVDNSSLVFSGNIGEKSTSQAVKITNVGKGTLEVANVSSTLDNVEVDASACTTLQPGESCSFLVSATIETAQASGQLRVNLKNATAAFANVQVTLNGTQAQREKRIVLQPSKTTLSALIGGTDTTSVIVRNESEDPVEVSNYQSDNSSIRIVNAADCIGALPAKQECTLQVEYKPTASQNKASLLTAFTDGTPAEVSTSFLTKTLTAQVSINNLVLDYGVLNAPSSKTLSTTLTNTGEAPLTFQWQTPVQVNSSGCTTALTPGASCVLSATYASSQAHVLNATITGTSTALGTPVSIKVVGQTVVPDLNAKVQVSEFSCSSPMVNQEGTCSLVISNNNTSASVDISNITTNTQNAALTTTCAPQLKAAESCGITIKYTSNTPNTVSMPVSWNIGTTPYSKTALLTFKAYNLEMVPTLPDATVNTTSTGTLKYTNSSDAPLSNLTFQYSPEFTVVSTNCSTSLASKASCETTLSYKGLSVGSLAGKATVSSTQMTKTFDFAAQIISSGVVVTTSDFTGELLGFSKSGLIRKITNNGKSAISLNFADITTTVNGVQQNNYFVIPNSSFQPRAYRVARANNNGITFGGKTGNSSWLGEFSMQDLYPSSNSPLMCGNTADKLLQPGASCMILEMPETFKAAEVYQGFHLTDSEAAQLLSDKIVYSNPTVKLSNGETLTWTSATKVVYPKVRYVSHSPVMANGGKAAVVVEITNPGSRPLSVLSVYSGQSYQSPATTQFTIQDNSCRANKTSPVVLEDLPAKSTCTLTLLGPLAAYGAGHISTLPVNLVLARAHELTFAPNATDVQKGINSLTSASVMQSVQAVTTSDTTYWNTVVAKEFRLVRNTEYSRLQSQCYTSYMHHCNQVEEEYARPYLTLLNQTEPPSSGGKVQGVAKGQKIRLTITNNTTKLDMVPTQLRITEQYSATPTSLVSVVNSCIGTVIPPQGSCTIDLNVASGVASKTFDIYTSVSNNPAKIKEQGVFDTGAQLYVKYAQ